MAIHNGILLLFCFISSCSATGLDDGKNVASKAELEFIQNHKKPDSLPSALRFDLREPSAWRWKYIDEYFHEFSVLIRERSIDERLSNVIYTITSSKLNGDFFSFDSGSESYDEDLKRLVAGKQVDDGLCARQLEEMLALMNEFNLELETQRKNSTSKMQLDESRIRLARVLDSFGRYEAGHLGGKDRAQGAPDQCANSQLILPNSSGGLVPTRFCWAKLSLDKHLDSQLRAREKSVIEPRDHSMLVGICLPESCHSKSYSANTSSLFKQLVDSQFKLPKSIYIDENLNISSIFCPPDMSGGSASEYANLPLGGKMFFLALSLWLIIAFYATYMRKERAINTHSNTYRTSSLARKLWRALGCLNLQDSYNEFILATESDRTMEKIKLHRPIDLDTLNPAKILSGAFVVLSHIVYFHWNASTNFLKISLTYERDLAMKPFMIGTLVVDTFFVISGLLVSYVTLKKIHQGFEIESSDTMNENKQSSLKDRSKRTAIGYPLGGLFREVAKFLSLFVRIYAMRYLRLMPMLLIMFWFKKSVFVFAFGSSPMWDYGLNRGTLYGSCVQADTLLTPLFLWNSYIPLSQQCLGQAWSITNDLAFMLVAIPIILILSRRPKFGTILLVTACLTSIKLSLDAFADAKPYQMWEISEMKAYGLNYLVNDLAYLYSAPQFRFSSICSGIMAGYWLVWYERTAARHQRQRVIDMRSEELGSEHIWPSWFRYAATYFATAIAINSIIGIGLVNQTKQLLNPHHHQLYVHLNTTFRPIWATSNAIFFLRMATDWRKHFIMRQASGRFWKIITKLGYVILLIHMELFQLSLHSATSTHLFSIPRILYEFCAVYFLCLLMSATIHVLVENPLDKLIREFLLGSTARKTTAIDPERTVSFRHDEFAAPASEASNKKLL